MKINPPCPICNEISTLHDVVDFNKSCDEANGKFLKLSGIPIYYSICGRCGFCFAPEIMGWSLEEFEKKIYNDEYVLVDPDYIESRPKTNAANLTQMFGASAGSIRHLDYGGGEGLLSKILRESKWDSTSYDPFVDKNTRLGELGKFDLISAFEVFEHVPDVNQLMTQLTSLLADDGVILFSTLISDGNLALNKRIEWWYVAPRNGHISIFSGESLAYLGKNSGFNVGSFSRLFHVFYRRVPSWASHLIR